MTIYVVDTNVLVSGLLSSQGPCAIIVQHILNGQLSLAFDKRIVDEYREVLSRTQFGFKQEDIDSLIAAMRLDGQEIYAFPLQISLPDCDDLMFIEVAKAAEASIITRNSKHFPGISHVLTPREFLETFSSEGPMLS